MGRVRITAQVDFDARRVTILGPDGHPVEGRDKATMAAMTAFICATAVEGAQEAFNSLIEIMTDEQDKGDNQ